MDIPHNALVLVADGLKLLLLRNKGDASQIDLRTEDWEDQPDPKNRDIHSDAPGLQQQRFGYGRPALDEPDYHQQNEDRFAADIADRLNHMALAGKVEDIAVIAPARTMGVLRQHWHKEAQKRVICEITKEMIDRPTPDIEALLVGAAHPPS
ncbi:MAG: host attachment family protein [Chakrabartia sp.]